MTISCRLPLFILLLGLLLGWCKPAVEAATSTNSKPDGAPHLDIIALYLKTAKLESDAAIEDCLLEISRLIAGAKEKSPAFAETAARWNRNTELLEKEFNKVITAEELVEAAEQAINKYVKTVVEIENNMLTKIREDFPNLSETSRLQTLEASLSSEEFQRAIVRIHTDIQKKIDSILVEATGVIVGAQAGADTRLSATETANSSASSHRFLRWHSYCG